MERKGEDCGHLILTGVPETRQLELQPPVGSKHKAEQTYFFRLPPGVYVSYLPAEIGNTKFLKETNVFRIEAGQTLIAGLFSSSKESFVKLGNKENIDLLTSKLEQLSEAGDLPVPSQADFKLMKDTTSLITPEIYSRQLTDTVDPDNCGERHQFTLKPASKPLSKVQKKGPQDPKPDTTPNLQDYLDDNCNNDFSDYLGTLQLIFHRYRCCPKILDQNLFAEYLDVLKKFCYAEKYISNKPQDAANFISEFLHKCMFASPHQGFFAYDRYCRESALTLCLLRLKQAVDRDQGHPELQAASKQFFDYIDQSFNFSEAKRCCESGQNIQTVFFYFKEKTDAVPLQLDYNHYYPWFSNNGEIKDLEAKLISPGLVIYETFTIEHPFTFEKNQISVQKNLKFPNATPTLETKGDIEPEQLQKDVSLIKEKFRSFFNIQDNPVRTEEATGDGGFGGKTNSDYNPNEIMGKSTTNGQMNSDNACYDINNMSLPSAPGRINQNSMGGNKGNSANFGGVNSMTGKVVDEVDEEKDE